MRFTLLLLIAGTALAATWPAAASGSSTARPPAPRKSATKVDTTQYDLGQKVFNGRVSLASTPEMAASQKPRLETLQSRLPGSVAQKKDLPAMAGTLSDEQLTALEYYVGRTVSAVLIEWGDPV